MEPAGPSVSEISAWCVAYLSQMLERPAAEIDPEAPFTRLGVDSATSTYFLVELEEWLGVELDPEIVFEYPTIGALARYAFEQKRRSTG